jgi:hypothetical protein
MSIDFRIRHALDMNWIPEITVSTGTASTAEGPWFDQPDEMWREQFSAEQGAEIRTAAADYRQNGYLIRDFGFSESDLDEAAAFTRSVPGERVQDAWLVSRAIRRLAASKSVMSFLDALYRRPSFPFQTLNFARGSRQATHSDAFHFNSRPAGFMCGVWIALEDIHPDSGPLHYFPGSHRLPVLTNADLAANHEKLGYEALVASIVQREGLKQETALIRRGQAFIWAANLLHGGTPILDPTRTRLSQVTHYYFRDCSYFTPMDSYEPRGKVFWREPYDIAARRFVGNAGGERPGLRYRLSERKKIWLKRPFSG